MRKEKLSGHTHFPHLLPLCHECKVFLNERRGCERPRGQDRLDFSVSHSMKNQTVTVLKEFFFATHVPNTSANQWLALRGLLFKVQCCRRDTVSTLINFDSRKRRQNPSRIA